MTIHDSRDMTETIAYLKVQVEVLRKRVQELERALQDSDRAIHVYKSFMTESKRQLLKKLGTK